MDYSKIISVTGMSGLYEILSSKTDGAVVRSLEDNTTKFANTRKHNFSHLESIEIYTTSDNAGLKDVFQAMKKSDTPIPTDMKNADKIKAYFKETYPNLDFERVYASDMKKMIKWFGILEKHEVDYTSANEENPDASSEANPTKPHRGTGQVKEARPQNVTPRKIQSRGVK